MAFFQGQSRVLPDVKDKGSEDGNSMQRDMKALADGASEINSRKLAAADPTTKASGKGKSTLKTAESEVHLTEGKQKRAELESKKNEVPVDGYNEIRHIGVAAKDKTGANEETKLVAATAVAKDSGITEQEIKVPTEAEVDIPINVNDKKLSEGEAEVKEVEVPVGDGARKQRPVNIWLKLMLFLRGQAHHHPAHEQSPENDSKSKGGSVMLMHLAGQSEQVQHLQHIEQQLCRLQDGLEKLSKQFVDMAFAFFVLLLLVGSVAFLMLICSIVTNRKKSQQLYQARPLPRRVVAPGVNKGVQVQVDTRPSADDKKVQQTSITIQKTSEPSQSGCEVQVEEVQKPPSSRVEHLGLVQSKERTTRDIHDDVSWDSTQTTSPCSAPGRPPTPQLPSSTRASGGMDMDRKGGETLEDAESVDDSTTSSTPTPKPTPTATPRRPSESEWLDGPSTSACPTPPPKTPPPSKKNKKKNEKKPSPASSEFASGSWRAAGDLLSIHPTKIQYRNPNGKSQVKEITIKNVMTHNVGWKTKCNKQNLYSFKPAKGILAPGKSEKIVFEMKGGATMKDIKDGSRHRFVLLSMTWPAKPTVYDPDMWQKLETQKGAELKTFTFDVEHK